MVDTGVYQIINVKSGTALDASGTDEGAIIGWEKHQGANQKWYIKKNDNEKYTIKNLNSGKFLGLASADYKDNLSARSVGGESEAYWHIRKESKEEQDVYRFFVPDTLFNLDLTGWGNSENGTPVAIWREWEDGRNQCWNLIRLS